MGANRRHPVRRHDLSGHGKLGRIAQLEDDCGTGTPNGAWIEGLVGRAVSRKPIDLGLHHALQEFSFLAVEEFNKCARLKTLSIPAPIIITPEGTILAGFGAWQLATFEPQSEIPCIEYAIGEEQILPFILAYHQPRPTWNAFVRISMARTMKSKLQETARENMRAGGKHKGSTNLPKADRIDVRREIAKLAGSGTGNVTKVEMILNLAHPNIIVALQSGLLSIHQAWKWCKLSKAQQKEEFAFLEEARTRRRIVRDLAPGALPMSFDPARIIEALHDEQSRQPGSITIRAGLGKDTVIVLGQEFLAGMDDQRELNLET
jgi:hypothetical protein